MEKLKSSYKFRLAALILVLTSALIGGIFCVYEVGYDFAYKEEELYHKKKFNRLFSVLTSLNELSQKNGLPLEEAKAKALKVLKTFEDEQKTKMWVIDVKHSLFKPVYGDERVQTLHLRAKDIFFPLFLQKIHGKALKVYLNGKEKEYRYFPKVLYVRFFEPWHWIVGYQWDEASLLESYRKEFLGLGVLISLIVCTVLLLILKTARDFNGAMSRFAEVLKGIKRQKFEDVPEPLSKDFSLLKKVMEDLKTELLRFMWVKNVFNKSEIPMCMIDSNLKLVNCNEPVARLLGYSSKEALLADSVHISEISSFYQADGRDSFEKAKELVRLVFENGCNRCEWRFCKLSGEVFCVEMITMPVMFKGEKLIYCIWRDLTKDKEIYYQSITDPLTQSFNRWYFVERLKEEMERAMRSGTGFALIMIDIDHFKQVNDRFGHNVGDKVLKRLAQLIKSRLRKIDTFARWGGEEFMVLLPGTTVSGAVALAEELRKKLEGLNIEGVVKITASFGVVSYCKGDTLESLIERVDKMMYKAKHEGRNCVRWTESCN